MNNKNLFWYGFKSRIQIFLGIFLMLFGLSSFWFIPLLGFLFLVGIYSFFIGKRNLFDYKRKAGYIVYKD
jgi:hypothetical protein